VRIVVRADFRIEYETEMPLSKADLEAIRAVMREELAASSPQAAPSPADDQHDETWEMPDVLPVDRNAAASVLGRSMAIALMRGGNENIERHRNLEAQHAIRDDVRMQKKARKLFNKRDDEDISIDEMNAALDKARPTRSRLLAKSK
jgi:hypothetical protein